MQNTPLMSVNDLRGPAVLDQARDPWEPLFRGTAQQYDMYLRGEYRDNARNFADGWESHFANMRTAIECMVLQQMEEKKKKREEMNVACIGLGLSPADRDFDQRLCHTIISRLQRVAVVDFSRVAIHEATQSLIHRGRVDPSRILQMQYDITSGYSTLLDQYLRPKFEGVHTEDDFVQMSKELDRIDISAELDARLADAVAQRGPQDTASTVGEPEVPGGMNTARRPFKLSIGGSDVPLDLIIAPMVVAGTAVATESDLWEVFQNVTDATDRSGGATHVVLAERKRVLHRLHELVADYNTVVCTRSIMNILFQNRSAAFLGLSDFNTRYKDGRGEFPRLHPDRVQRELMDYGIDCTTSGATGQWIWDDSPSHCHSCLELQAQRVEAA